jgi:hypothetical protein
MTIVLGATISMSQHFWVKWLSLAFLPATMTCEIYSKTEFTKNEISLKISAINYTYYIMQTITPSKKDETFEK